MSDGDLRAAIDQMEGWVSNPDWEPEAEAVTEWNHRLQQAIAHAEKGPDWPALVCRAHAVGQQLAARVERLVQRQAEMRTRLDRQEHGNRALRGYRASSL
jgi:hypothetical protein